MKNKPVTLVISDLDGTLLDSNKNVSERTKKAIQALKQRGILFGIASGRPVESGIVLSKNWGLDKDISFLIGMNGGVLYDVRRDEKDTFAWINGDTVLDIIHKFRSIPYLHFEVMVGNERYVEWSTPETLANADLYGEEEIIVDFEDFLKDRRVHKLIIRSAPEQQKDVAALANKLNIPGVAHFSTSPILYEYVNPDINKGFGLQKACDHFGLNLENVVAFGDENNDVEMMMLAGQGVCMNNGKPAAKIAANVVSDYTNDEDAVARYIEEVILPCAEGIVEEA